MQLLRHEMRHVMENQGMTMPATPHQSNAAATPDEDTASEYTTWTTDDSAAFDQALMHPSLVDGPLPEMVEGYITGTVISPFDGLAEELLAPLLSLFELDLDTLPPDAREPLVATVQKRMDAILDSMDQTLVASVEGRAAVGLEPLLTDWAAAQDTMDEMDEQGEQGKADEAVAPMPDKPSLPKSGELWARGMQVAELVWREDHWQRIDKHTRKDIDKLYQPIHKLCAPDKTAVTEERVRARLLDDALNSAHILYSMTQNYYDRLAVTPAPIVKETTPGRNDPCSCGSGKKYKKCCGA